MSQLTSFRDLRVYQKLKALHLEVHDDGVWKQVEAITLQIMNEYT
jgi:hypothetical protein